MHQLHLATRTPPHEVYIYIYIYTNRLNPENNRGIRNVPLPVLRRIHLAAARL